MEERHELYLAGSWVRASGNERIGIINPSTEEVAFTVPEATEGEIDRAIGGARAVLDSGIWSSLPIGERAETVNRFADALAARAEGLKVTLATEMGAPVSRGSEGPAAVGVAKFYSAIAGAVPFEQHRSGAFRPSLIERVPVGVVAAVVPWNAPIYLAVGKLVPALLAGCPVILKPAPETAFSAYAIAEAVDAAGFPPGLVSVVPAGRERSEYLVSHPGVDKSSFTGSSATGRRVATIAIDQFKRFSLELGGKSAGIVMPDADIAAVLPAIINGTMMNCGQVCALLSRILVPRKLADTFLDAYLPEVGRIVVGDALDPNTQMGPLVAQRQLTRVLGYIEAGKQEGARIVLGGGRPAGLDKGWFVEPTVFADVDNSMRIAREEIFGPVISVLTYDTLDEAVAIANDSPYGLSGAVFGSDKGAAVEVAQRLRTGTVTVNTSIDFDFDMPFGGFKCSGIGREYGGVDGILNYTETRAIGL
jgi:acyl-CoA reductase-like NAD-dependent aldehyde dehydrogenase